MPMLDIALKEWAVICDLLLEGRMALLLRKGGIYEAGGPGVFELEYPRFALFPSWAHQKPEMIKPEYRDRVQVLDEPDEVTLRGVGEVARIWEVPHRRAIEALDDLHPWTPAQIDMRFNYKPERPLYLMAVRAARLNQPKIIPNTPAYAGCRSWVPLSVRDAVDDADVWPVLGDVEFEAIVERVERAMET